MVEAASSTAGVVVRAAKAAYFGNDRQRWQRQGRSVCGGRGGRDSNGMQPSELVVDSTLPSSPAAGEEAEERGEVKQAPPRAPAVDTVQAAAAAPASPNSTLASGGTIQAAHLRPSRLPHLGLRWEPRQAAVGEGERGSVTAVVVRGSSVMGLLPVPW